VDWTECIRRANFTVTKGRLDTILVSSYTLFIVTSTSEMHIVILLGKQKVPHYTVVI
jgi:hypothetical protein